MNITKNIPALFILIFSLAFMSGCTETLPDGRRVDVGIAQKIGSFVYNPVYEEQVVGETITEVIDESTGEVLSTTSEPVIEKVIIRYEPNALGQLLEAGADLVPIPGVGTGVGGLLGVGSIALLAMERLRRKEKAGKVSMEEKFHVAVGGVKDFLKTEDGKKIEDALKKKISDKASEYGISKEYKTAVNIAKAVL